MGSKVRGYGIRVDEGREGWTGEEREEDEKGK